MTAVTYLFRSGEPTISKERPRNSHGSASPTARVTQAASLRTISGRGATLQAVDAQLKPGDTVDVQYEGTKAQFRIVWCGKTGTPMQGEIGIENLSAEIKLWDIDVLHCAVAVGEG